MAITTHSFAPSEFSDIDSMISCATRRGQWLRCHYQDLWLSPRQLRSARAGGHFGWGPDNWELQDPRVYIDQLEKEMRATERTLAAVRLEVKETGTDQC